MGNRRSLTDAQNESLRVAVRGLLKIHGSQTKLAELLDIKQGALSVFLAGKSGASYAFATRVAEAMQVSVGRVLAGGFVDQEAPGAARAMIESNMESAEGALAQLAGDLANNADIEILKRSAQVVACLHHYLIVLVHLYVLDFETFAVEQKRARTAKVSNEPGLFEKHFATMSAADPLLFSRYSKINAKVLEMIGALNRYRSGESERQHAELSIVQSQLITGAFHATAVRPNLLLPPIRKPGGPLID